MARIETDANYTTPATFSRATAGTDLFKKEDIQNVAWALSEHEHGVGDGMPVLRIGPGVVGSANIAPGTLDLPGGLTVSGNLFIDAANWAIQFSDLTHYLQYAPAGRVGLLAWTHDFSVTGFLEVGANATITGNASVSGGTIYVKTTSNQVFSDGNNISLRTPGAVYLRNTADTGFVQVRADEFFGQSINLQGGNGNNHVIYWGDASHYMQYAPAGDPNILAFTHTFQANILRATSGVQFPNASITNAMLATPPGGGTTVKNSFFSAPTYSITPLSTWNESPIQATATWTGAGTFIRIDWVVTLRVTSGTVGIGIGLDGVLTWPNIGAVSQQAAGSQSDTASGFLYVPSPSAGSHKVSVFLYSGVGGNSLDNGSTQILTATEYKS